jgi:hypothetical protein
MFLYPFLSDPRALVRPRLVPANSHRYTPLRAPDQGITHQSGHSTHDRFDVSLALFQQAEKLLGSGA